MHTPLSYGLRNPYRNLKSENSQDYAQKLYVHELGFRTARIYTLRYEYKLRLLKIHML